MQTVQQYSQNTLSHQAQETLNNKTLRNESNESAMKAAKEFEAVFLATMMENMFTGVEISEPFGGGQAEKIFRSMQISEYAKDMSTNGGLDIAEHIYREIIAVQEGNK